MKFPKATAIPINILVIEDNPGDFFLIEEYIEEMFVASQIIHAVNFNEAREALLRNDVHFDSILLDATLPDNEGLNLISDLLVLSDQIPVIILTGYQNLEFSINSLSLGVSEYLLKDEISAYSLYKSVLFSIERKKYLKNIEESEKRYSELFHLSPNPMWVYSKSNLQIQQVNFAAIDHYGFSEDEFLKMSVLDLTPDFDMNDNHALDNNTIDSISVKQHILKDGTIIDVQIEQNSIVIDGVSCFIMLANDITELVETQDSLKNAYKNIIKIEEKEKEKFAAELHDGLQQNIVASKLIFSFLIEQKPALADEPRVKLLNETLQSSLDECAQIIREVRPKKIIENGFDKELDYLIEKIKATGNCNVNVDKNIDLNELFNYYNLMHIYRIIQELFSNSLKYASASQFDLSFCIQDDVMKLTFKDDGVGISEDVLLSKSSFISLKRRIQILNGSLEFFSELKKGVQFEIIVPLKK